MQNTGVHALCEVEDEGGRVGEGGGGVEQVGGVVEGEDGECVVGQREGGAAAERVHA